MIRIAHVLDDHAAWEERVALTYLMDRLPRDRCAQTLATITPAADPTFRCFPVAPARVPCIVPIAPLAAPMLARFVQQRSAALLHAWSVRCAVAAGSLHDHAVVVSLHDPNTATREARALRSITRPSRFAIACSCETVRRRLVEHGVSPECAVVIRPGVDFGLINRVRRGPLRKQLGIADEEFVSILPEPATRDGEQMNAAFAVTLHRRLNGGHRVILPGRSREADRIVQFQQGMPTESPLVATGDRIPFEHLVAIADALLITPRGDAPTTAIPWAMAAGAVVIGSATYAVAEIIANKVNGLLFKQEPDRSISPAVYRLLQRMDDFAKCREVARGQAYEVFSLRRFAEQYLRLYENVLAGRAPADGITDPALT